MKKLTLLSVLFLLITGVEQIKGQWIRPAQYQEMLDRGIDVDWWTDGNDYSNYNWDETASDFSDAGIRHIRITLENDIMSDPDFYRLDLQIRACLNHGIAPIIAYRPRFSRSGMPAYYYGRRITNWWRLMAERYRYYPAQLSFDILLEPDHNMFGSYNALNDFYEDCVTTIRISNPYRILFIAPSYHSDPMYLQYLRIPSRGDGYLMAEWHFMPRSGYDRAWSEWMNRRSYAQRWYRRRISAAAAWQRSTGILTWVGSWGSSSYFSVSYSNHAAAYTDFVCASLNAANIPFAVSGLYGNYNFAHRGWKAYAAAPMGRIFPHGGFAHSGSPAAGYRDMGFSIGNRRFGNSYGNGQRHDYGKAYADRNGYVRPRGGRRDGQTWNGNIGAPQAKGNNGFGFDNNGSGSRVYNPGRSGSAETVPYRGLPQNMNKTNPARTPAEYQPRTNMNGNRPNPIQQRNGTAARPMQRLPQQSDMPQRNRSNAPTRQLPSQRQQVQSRPSQQQQVSPQQQNRNQPRRQGGGGFAQRGNTTKV